jgi:alkylated DNA repair dioxygenase AlkB
MKNHEPDNQLSLGLVNEHGSSLEAYPEILPMPDADVVLYPKFFGREESDDFFEDLLSQTNWNQDRIKLYGKEVDLPRLTACYGDINKNYSYSGISMEHVPWTPSLLSIKRRVDEVAGEKFNSVLLNLYRNGKNRLSWHQDDESELGDNPVIGSVSFGSTRCFQFKHKYRKELKRIDVNLTHGSVLIMKGTTQRFWLHQIPKTARPVGPRINLTFRFIH